MGEARRRGSYEERKKQAIQRNKKELATLLSNNDPRTEAALRAGIAPFFSRMTPEEWQTRRARILDALKQVDGNTTELEKAKSIRYQEDEIAWYLFLCQQVLEDPLCTDVNQASRATPFIAGIGERWHYAYRVRGLERKIDEVLYEYRKEPDGLIFEILVALSYAAAGWDVEFLDARPPAKSPDLLVVKNGREFYVECKRLARRTSYAEQERNEFLRLWDAGKNILLEKNQWIWFKGTFHTELVSLPTNFLADVFRSKLPIGSGEISIYDGKEAIIHARLIDQSAVYQHLKQYRVKANSPMLNCLLGSDWAPLNSATTIFKLAKASQVVECEAPVLGRYIEEIAWACGFTREFDSEVSLNKKARDVTKHLSDATNQVPDDRPSIIHIAAETLEGRNVERLRTQKVMETIPGFITDKPVVAVRFHRFQSNQTVDILYEFDETVEKFQIDGIDLDDIPTNVVIPNDIKMRQASHWELYP